MARGARLVVAGLVVGLVAGLSGCGGGGIQATEVACNWATLPGNCWTASAAAAGACVDQSAAGRFVGGGTSSCTYDDGVTITFDSPAIDYQSNLPPAAFTVAPAAGPTCARLVQTASTLTLTTGLGTFQAEYGLAFEKQQLLVTCPDGSHYRIPDLSACSPLDLPGWTIASDGGALTLTLLHAPVSDPTLWTCALPPT